ncbi:hypothetical protein TNCV_2846561 [Trichonephila clavipes]|nr:hypothetical protein TNCV_2846561 [Trichonephila clavipes]
MDITPRKRTRTVTLSQHTSMTVKDIAAAVGVGKSSVSRIINQQKNFGKVSPKRSVNVDANPPRAAISAAIRRVMESNRFCLWKRIPYCLYAQQRFHLFKLQDADHERDADPPNPRAQ